MKLVVERSELLKALSWLRRVSAMTRESTVAMRFDGKAVWEWSCAGQSRGVEARGQWNEAMVSPVRPLLALSSTLSKGKAFEFIRTDSGFTIDGMSVRADTSSSDTPRIELPVNVTTAMVLGHIQRVGGDRLAQAGYATIVARAIAERKERVNKAIKALAPCGIDAAVVERAVDVGVQDPRAGMDHEAELQRVKAAALAFDSLSPLGVRWEDLWVMINKR